MVDSPPLASCRVSVCAVVSMVNFIPFKYKGGIAGNSVWRSTLAPMARKSASRRNFIGGLAAAGLLKAQTPAASSNRVAGFDHVALPMQNVDAMIAFYKSLGFAIQEGNAAISVYIGPNMIKSMTQELKTERRKWSSNKAIQRNA